MNHREYGLMKKQRYLETGSLPGYGSQADKFYRCDVIFGSPSADCRGTGICKIVAQQQAPDQAEPQQCRRTQAVVAYGAADHSVSLLLFPEFLCATIVRNHLSKGVLIMKEPCRLPNDLRAMLHLQDTHIPAGVYAVEIKMGYYQINFSRKTMLQ